MSVGEEWKKHVEINHDYLGVVLDPLDEQRDTPSPTALRSIAQWVILPDHADVAHVHFSDMIRQLIAGNELGCRVKSQKDEED